MIIIRVIHQKLNISNWFLICFLITTIFRELIRMMMIFMKFILIFFKLFIIIWVLIFDLIDICVVCVFTINFHKAVRLKIVTNLKKKRWIFEIIKFDVIRFESVFFLLIELRWNKLDDKTRDWWYFLWIWKLIWKSIW